METCFKEVKSLFYGLVGGLLRLADHPVPEFDKFCVVLLGPGLVYAVRAIQDAEIPGWVGSHDIVNVVERDGEF